MRKGMNPRSPFNKTRGQGTKIDRKIPPELPVVVVVTNLPDDHEYHKERIEIVTKSLTLCRQNAGTEHWLVVWDNGSKKELRDWLIDFAPDQLIFSHNIGVANTMRRVLGMYIESVVTWNNDDLIYYPNWLQPQIDILKAYPQAASVTGCVTRLYSGKADDSTVTWARHNAKLGRADTPLEWDKQHADSIGKFGMEKQYIGTTIPQVEYKGVKALVGGNHCQMTVRPPIIYPLIPRTDMYMVPLFQTLDTAVNSNGHLRLMTPERLTRHIGNVMTDADRKEIDELV